MPKTINKKTINKKTINKKTKLKNTVNVKINIDNSRKTTGRKGSTKAPTQQPLVNFPSSQPMRIQQLEPKQQFNNADLSNKLDSFQKQFKLLLENKPEAPPRETTPTEAAPQETTPPEPRPPEPRPREATPPEARPPEATPTTFQRLSSFFENKIDSFSVKDQEAIDKKEQQIKIKKEQREQRLMEAQQEHEAKRLIKMQREAEKKREKNERSMMESEDIPEKKLGEEDIIDFIENASDEDIKLWLQNAQPDVKKATLKLLKHKKSDEKYKVGFSSMSQPNQFQVNNLTSTTSKPFQSNQLQKDAIEATAINEEEPQEATLITEQELTNFLLTGTKDQIKEFLKTAPKETRTSAKEILKEIEKEDNLDDNYKKYVEAYKSYYNNNDYLKKDDLNNQKGKIDSKLWGRKATDINNSISQYGTYEGELKRKGLEEIEKERKSASKANIKKIAGTNVKSKVSAIESNQNTDIII